MKVILKSLLFAVFVGQSVFGQKPEPFLHPGIRYSRPDLMFFKDQVQKRTEPWAGAYAQLKRTTPLDFEPRAFRHIVSGPYSDPDIGGRELREAARMAHDYALLWFISGEEIYAEKARAIFHAWEQGIWSFDENNTKLLAALACDPLVNAAEILRHAWPRWREADTQLVNRLLMSSFYPVLRYYFPEANGNWDGANIRALLGIAIFTDNRELFDNAVRHYLFSQANGSLVKYIYPSGQCQETTRDQGHVQMGLGLFAEAARIAWTQGVDLFGLADNRLTLGLEYTSRYLLGEEPQAYGVISPDKRDKISSSYMHAVRHYNARGVRMPYTERIVNRHFREGKDALSILTATRAEQARTGSQPTIDLVASSVGYPAGAQPTDPAAGYDDAIRVKPGEPLQAALDRGARERRQVVALAGLHPLTETLRIPSGTTLLGEGLGTVIMGGKANGLSAIAAKGANLEDVTIANLILEGAYTYGTEPENTARFRRTGKFANQKTGLQLTGSEEGGFRNITLRHLTIHNFSRNGAILAGVDGLTIDRCDFSDNGTYVVPGPRLQHNLKLVHVRHATIAHSRFDTSLKGAGIYLDHSSQIRILSCEVARNAWYGILASECRDLAIRDCLMEGNDSAAVYLSYLYRGSDQVDITNNTMQLNNGYAIESYKTTRLNLAGNRYSRNTLRSAQEHISQKPVLLMEDGSADRHIDQ